MSDPRPFYVRPPAGHLELRPGRVALLLTLAAISAGGGYLAGHSMGSSETASPPGSRAAAHRSALSQRLSRAPAIGALSIPAPPPPPTTPTTTATTPTVTSPSVPQQSAPQQPAPAPTPTPAPAPTPTPAPSGGGGGSFDDSG